MVPELSPPAIRQMMHRIANERKLRHPAEAVLTFVHQHRLPRSCYPRSHDGLLAKLENIYARAAMEYATIMESRIGQALDCEDLKTALMKGFDVALDIYTSDGPEGCFVICTAPAEALTSPVCQHILSQSLDSIDALFLRRLERERKTIQSDSTDLPAVAAQLGSTLHSLALRVRAGRPRDRLQRFAAGSVAQVIIAIGRHTVSGKTG